MISSIDLLLQKISIALILVEIIEDKKSRARLQVFTDRVVKLLGNIKINYNYKNFIKK
ncbi:hypothetical protein HOG21_05495 [bacterium]|nr:hypothetical protein [bacterium]